MSNGDDKRPDWWARVLAVVGIVLTLGLFLWDQVAADVRLEMSPWIRVHQWQHERTDKTHINLYAQPTFASTGRNARVEIIKDIRLCVKSLGNGDVLEFQANTCGAFSNKKPSETEVRYNLLSDAGPLVIAPGEERAPLVKFEPEHPQNKFFFAPGQYQVTLTAEREIAGKQLRKTVVLEALSADDIERMNAIQQNQRHIPLEVLQTLSDANNPCSG
jgi:hypothetical protein